VISDWIAAAADRQGDAPYLEDTAADAAGGRTLTYAGLRQATRAWDQGLDRAGVPAGAGVAVRLPDPLEYATALVAILAAGRVVIPLDPDAPAAEVARVLAIARPLAAVSDSGRDLPPGLAVLRSPQAPAAQEAAGAADTAGGAEIPVGAATAGGIFLCTSGTTGTPKGILLRADQLSHVAAAVAGQHRLTRADRGYCCLPLFHVNAEVVGLLATLAARACLVLDAKFSRRGFWPLIERRRITWINAVPAIISVLAMDPPATRVPGRVRFVRSASAPLPPGTLRRFEASMITANPVDGPRKAGSVGRPAGAEVRVVASVSDPVAGPCGVAERAGSADVPPAGSAYVPCPAGTVGRVQIRGPGVIREYAQGGPAGAIDPEGGPAGAIDAEGWLDTGDLGHLDQDGYLFLAGRSDDVINRGGEKIYPREIEDFLVTQPGVWSAAVVAAQDEVLGQRPVAYVVPAGPWRPHEMAETLREACEEALPRPKRPSAFYLVQELPLGPTGKVARHRLRSAVWSGLCW